MNQKPHHVAVIIVGFGNPEDVQDCLGALALATPSPSFDIFICENGGKEAFQELYDVLSEAGGACTPYTGDPVITINTDKNKFVELECLTLKGRSSLVWAACAACNLGYAGAINAWINLLQTRADWDGLWILNPDTKPFPNALAKLVQRAVSGNKGMVSCTLVPDNSIDRIHNRGLRWNKFSATVISIGYRDLLCSPFDKSAIEAIMDSPSGASTYVTRTCVERIGPMDERFFLYYEDIDWGMRAKKFGLGYASESVVLHKGGTTIGSSVNRAKRSELSVYLESRNRLLFVKKHQPWLSVPNILFSFVSAFQYLFSGSPRNCRVAFQGIFAGWNGETGPPSDRFNDTLRGVTRRSC